MLFTAYWQKLFQSKAVAWKLLILCLLLFSCDTGKIANLGSIRINADYGIHSIRVRIFLQDSSGNYLMWSQSILGPQEGLNAVPEEDFKTNVKVYSMKYGDKNQKVYDGRLADLHWNRAIPETPRVLLGDIPFGLIKGDAERDTNLGIIELTLTTPKQGDFFAQTEGVKIYPW